MRKSAGSSETSLGACVQKYVFWRKGLFDDKDSPFMPTLEIRYNDNSTVTKHSLKRQELVTNIARILYLIPERNIYYIQSNEI